MDSFYEQYSELNESSRDEKQIRAGVDRLDRFGSFGTYVELARKGALGNTIDDVLKQPTRVVFHLMLYDKLKSEFERELLKQK